MITRKDIKDIFTNEVSYKNNTNEISEVITFLRNNIHHEKCSNIINRVEDNIIYLPSFNIIENTLSKEDLEFLNSKNIGFKDDFLYTYI